MTDDTVLLDPEDEHLRPHLRSPDRYGYPRLSRAYNREAVHRHIMGKRDGLVIDHINGNKLDNRRSNLRHVTQHTNTLNRNCGDSPDKYIYTDPRDGVTKYSVRIKRNFVIHNVGTFASIEQAREARDAWLKT
jgi:hypothetical protein